MTKSSTIDKAVAEATAYVGDRFRYTHYEFQTAFTKGFAMALLNPEDRKIYHADTAAFGEWTGGPPRRGD